ncbi:DUF4312 family protein [Vibrio anguillarum]|jgi:uncharacterized protein (TIGR03578 family)|uniref:DUF4312 family protein n=4 Tax=Vibrio TaxID=662 RepID=A0A191W227_VIBAN|nr:MULTISPECIES: DUF4312 family protein [Vibrio]OXX68848.1 cytoplasmic protein [Vibrio sp. V03_P4A6T147]AQM20116.1 cytoplasmic protein [Vibrio anguillarum]ARV28203.1 hypothetical protein A6A12_0530 [Vibrio anguillarum]ASF91227.1 cytoplasmic protein [Vibrio anguillarum]ASF99275.1 cytoplasmic protein [Vibrio anguillarum]
MKEQLTTKVTVSGKGETKQQAFAAALSQVQPTLLKNNAKVLLRIEPLDVNVLQAEEKVKREKFLFFFLARDRRQYSVKLEVTVSLTHIDVEQVDFKR